MKKLFLLFLLLLPDLAFAKKHDVRKYDIDFFPVPVFSTRPDEKETYGVMPVLLFSDPDTKAIQTIVAGFAQYNKIIKANGAGLVQHWPHPNANPDEQWQIFAQLAQRYYRELSGSYINPHWKNDFYLNFEFSSIKSPFHRFYGYGANTSKSAESNYVSDTFFTTATLGYYVLPEFRVSFAEQVYAKKLYGQAIFDVQDTLTAFAGTTGVANTTNLIHKIFATYDTRPNGSNSKSGFMTESTYFFSHEDLLSENTFQGYSVEGIFLQPFFKERTVTALRFFLQDEYGSDIPFYLQSRLGGDSELRSFIPDRFIDTGKIMFTWEQRILVLEKEIFGIPVALSLDPYFEVGRVFHHLNHLGFQDYQPVGGLGVRLIVPPNMTARIDTSVGTEGYGVYMLLGYPF